MNYYRRYLGDYVKKTTRLSMVEHGAYSMLLDAYYIEERPIPLDLETVYEICKATKPAFRAAVDKVLDRYFEKRADGFHNKRADEEIAAAIQARDNGGRGGRPRKTITGTQTESVTGSVTGHETGLITERGGKTETGTGHPPTTNHQPNRTTLSGSPPDPLQLVPPKPNGHGALHEEAERVLTYLNRATGHAYHFRNPKGGKLTPNGQVIVARMAEGYTGVQLREVVMLKAEQWRADMKMAQYLRPKTLFGRENFAQYIGELEPEAA